MLNYWLKLSEKNTWITIHTYIQPTVKAVGHNNFNRYGLIAVRIYDTYAKQKLNAYMDYLNEEWTKEFEKEFDVEVEDKI